MDRIRQTERPHGPQRPNASGLAQAFASKLACVALASLIVACASDPPNQISEGHAGAPGVRRVLLCPPNLVVALRPEIQSGANAIDREIAAYFESQGRELDRIGLIEGRKAWKQAVAEAKAAGVLTNAPRIFVDRLAQDHEFDVVVMPSLLLLQTRMDANNASWDGVTRRMKTVNAPVLASGRNDSLLSKGLASGGISGPAWVTSLHVLVFARDGSRVFEGRGGIEFVQEIDHIDAGKSFRYTLRPNSSIFQNREILHEGVVQAFTPYLVPPEA